MKEKLFTFFVCMAVAIVAYAAIVPIQEPQLFKDLAFFGSAADSVIDDHFAKQVVMKADSGQTADIMDVLDSSSTELGGITVAGLAKMQKYRATTSAVTITTNKGASLPSSYTITSPTKSHYSFTCSDTDTCEIFCGETGAVSGDILMISNRGAQSIVVQDVSTTCNLSGDATLGTGDMMWAVYDSAAFIQAAPESDN